MSTSITELLEKSVVSGITECFLKVTEQNGKMKIRVKLFSKKQPLISGVQLYTILQGDEVRHDMSCFQGKRVNTWIVEFEIHNSYSFNFRFKIKTGSGSDIFYDQSGLYKYKISNKTNFKWYKKNAPNWIADAVIYHIFVDRFCNSNLVDHYFEGTLNELKECDFFGGNLEGIEGKISYLIQLGVNVICLTPIFKSQKNHRYDTIDYYVIDEKIGGHVALISLLRACRKVGMKIIFDGVFNHVSHYCQWFKDAVDNGTMPFRDFFIFDNDNSYESFWGDKSLPKLNYKSNQLKELIFKSDESVVQYWLKHPYQIDGWRIDASCMIGKYPNSDVNLELLSEIYRYAKTSNAQAYIVGEQPFDPTEITPYYHMDGITNYAGFYTPLLYWLDRNRDFDVMDFKNALSDFLAIMGLQFLKSSKNFIGNHDKQRLFSQLQNIESYFIAIAFLFTYPGVPCLYYGEEIGLTDIEDGYDARAPMKWNQLSECDHMIYNFTKRLIDLYKSNLALQESSVNFIFASNEIFAFERQGESNSVLVILINAIPTDGRLELNTFSNCIFGLKELDILYGEGIDVMWTNDEMLSVRGISTRGPIIINLTNKIH